MMREAYITVVVIGSTDEAIDRSIRRLKKFAGVEVDDDMLRQESAMKLTSSEIDEVKRLHVLTRIDDYDRASEVARNFVERTIHESNLLSGLKPFERVILSAYLLECILAGEWL